ncbi:MAG: hypothetical protein JRJ27_11675 [Deltaproteobacteria bacterium]|nr:hypothetical protein [Deltaproteobacteria bacterium]
MRKQNTSQSFIHSARCDTFIFGSYILKDLEIASVGMRPNTRYGILMDKSRIEIVY